MHYWTFEKIRKTLINKIEHLELIMLKEANKSSIQNKIINLDINFEKGLNIKSNLLTNQITKKLFINILAINNKPNKYLINYQDNNNVNNFKLR